MTTQNLTLTAIGLAALIALYLLFTKKWTNYTKEKPAPFWLGLVTVLSAAAIIFSIHALLVTHGILKLK
jgi:hypothetical protein